jgi:putative tryptophan/tyrosine transport system substrate-binding protein
MVSSEAKNGFNCVSCGTHRARSSNENPAQSDMEGRGLGNPHARGMGLLLEGSVSETQGADIERTIGAFARTPNGGLLLAPDVSTQVHRDLIIALAARYSLPAVYWERLFVAAGGLMSYGADYVDMYRQAASYVDRILRGDKPADLPVQAATKFETIVNLKTAKALGLTVPPGLLVAADEVIE